MKDDSGFNLNKVTIEDLKSKLSPEEIKSIDPSLFEAAYANSIMAATSKKKKKTNGIEDIDDGNPNLLRNRIFNHFRRDPKPLSTGQLAKKFNCTDSAIRASCRKLIASGKIKRQPNKVGFDYGIEFTEEPILESTRDRVYNFLLESGDSHSTPELAKKFDLTRQRISDLFREFEAEGKVEVAYKSGSRFKFVKATAGSVTLP